MDLQEITDLTNDLAISRLVLDQANKALENYLEANKDYANLILAIENAKNDKVALQSTMLEVMSEQGLKSYKTEMASVSRSVRKTASINPAFKKDIEASLKAGEKVKGWELKETEFISIRPTKQ